MAFKAEVHNAMRKAERAYIESQFIMYKNNMARSWQIMKDIINKNKKSSNLSEHFHINGQMTNNKQTIANSFNDFYINIGPNICKNRPMSHTSPMTYMDHVLMIPCLLNLPQRWKFAA